MNELIQKVIAKESLCRELGIGNHSDGAKEAYLRIHYNKEDLEVFLNDVV